MEIKELKIPEQKPAEVKPVPIMQQAEPTLKDKVDALWQDATQVIKKKELKLPRRAKVRKRKAKKGWVGIVKIDENNVARGEKVLLRDSSFITKSDGLFHATEGKEMLWWDGKFPVFIQEAKKVNPKNITFNEGKNETYGQKYIMAKMLAEAIKPKRGGWNIILILIAIGAGIFLLSKLGLFGGGG